MPMPPSTKDRARQILAWLVAVYPVAYPVTLRFVKSGTGYEDGFGADCQRVGRRFVIRVTPGMPWYDTIEMVMHEYAHAMTWPHSRVEHHAPDHSDEWALAFGRLYRHFHDEDGNIESRDYPWR